MITSMIAQRLPNTTDRNFAIDFVKGFLVITMVIYHTLNYFLSGYHSIYAYVNYVTQAFIFYSGFMCGTIYFKKFFANKWYVYKRLTIRGIKLTVLFVFLNLIIHATLNRNFNDQEMGITLFINNIFEIFTIGNERIARFAILIPIAYVLLISAPLINLFRVKYLLYFSLIFSFCIISFTEITLSYNISCVLTGMGGLFTGLIYKDLSQILKNRFIKYLMVALLFFFLFILIPFGIDARTYPILYFLYINVIISNIYTIGTFLNPTKLITRQIMKFGQYSLLLYLAQIFFLQIMKRLFNFRLGEVSLEHIFIIIFINLLLVGCCYLADYLRNKFIIVDKSYRFIFS